MTKGAGFQTFSPLTEALCHIFLL